MKLAESSGATGWLHWEYERMTPCDTYKGEKIARSMRNNKTPSESSDILGLYLNTLEMDLITSCEVICGPVLVTDQISGSLCSVVASLTDP